MVTAMLTAMVCGTCGVHFAMDSTFQRECQESGGSWYCPNGHPRVYRTPEVVKLRQSLQEAQQAAIDARGDAEKERKARARIERRARAGTCPFGCKRPFVNLGRHVATKHAEEKKAAV